MLVIDNLETADAFTRELTLESHFGGRLVYVVANQSAVARFRPLVEIGGSGVAEYGPEILLTPQSSFIDKISGAQFRSAVVGSPARVVAQLSEPGDILPASGTPFTGTLAASGGVAQAGGMTVLQHLDLSVGSGFSSIPSGYESLLVVAVCRSANAYVSDNLYMRLNSDVAANYDYMRLRGNAGAASSAASVGQTELRIGQVSGSLATANRFAVVEILVPGYGVSLHKTVKASCSLVATSAAGDMFIEETGGVWRSTDVVNALSLIAQGGGAFAAGSFATLYGLASS